MKKDCNIIQDLLPLYVENITSEQSREFIEEHIANCKECAKILEDLKQSSTPLSRNDDYYQEKCVQIFTFIKKRIKLKRLFTILISIIITLVLIASINIIQLNQVYNDPEEPTLICDQYKLFTEESVNSAAEFATDRFYKYYSNKSLLPILNYKLISIEKSSDLFCSLKLKELLFDPVYTNEGFTECIILKLTFRLPYYYNGSRHYNRISTVQYTLARNTDSEWIIIEQ